MNFEIINDGKMINIQRIFSMFTDDFSLVIIGGKHSRDQLYFNNPSEAVCKMNELRKSIEEHQSIRMFETSLKTLINPALTYSVDVMNTDIEFSNATGNRIYIGHKTNDDAKAEFERYKEWLGDHFTKDATFQGMIHDFADGEFFKIARRCSDTYYQMKNYDEGKATEFNPSKPPKEIRLDSFDRSLLYELIEEGKR